MSYFSTEYKNEVFSFMKNKLVNICDFDYISFGSDGESTSDEYVNDKIECAACDMGATWGDCGVSKAVFKFREFPDIVVKIPFKGYLNCEYAWDEEDEYWDFSSVESIATYDFENAGYNNLRCWDYCETESSNYELAVKAGVDSIFAPTEYIGEYMGIHLYISEYISNSFYFGDISCQDESKKTVKTIKENEKYYDISLDILGWYLEQNGKDKTSQLIKFLKDNNIHDLHSGNWKMTDDGQVKIIDYSSWND